MNNDSLNADSVVSTRGLTKQFGPLVAVNALDLDVSRGEIFGLVGPDGAGKTTTLRLLCGLLDPSAGEARIAGFDVTRDPNAVKDRIGYMAQKFGLYTDLTVQENMLFYADLFGITTAESNSLMDRLLRMTRMGPFRSRLAGKLSGGMKQKLSLMCTLLHHPQILFLDEPTNGVDPVSRRDFWAILYQLVKDGMTVVVTTAYLDEAERCNRVGLMHQGRLICCDAPASLKNQLDERCVEVQASDIRMAKTLLAKAAGVLSVEPAGSVLHLFFDAARSSAASLETILKDQGMEPVAFRPIVPSLEDVFIALIRKVSRQQ